MTKSIAPKFYAKDLQAFIEKALLEMQGKKLINPAYIHYIVLFLERLLRGEISRLLVNLPGRHLKTFTCSVCMVAFKLGHNPKLKFLIVAHNQDLAEDIVRQIREIMQTSWYQAVFATRVDPTHSRKRDFTIVGGGRVRSSAVKSVTGKGGDFIIFDDPHNALDWDNDHKKSEVIGAFEHLVSRRDGGKKSQMLVVCHRVAEDDVSAHLLERGDFEHVRLPLYAPRDMSFDLGYKTWRLAKGEALQPEEFPPDEIKRIRRNHQGTPVWLYFLQGLGSKKDDFQIEVSHFPFVEWNREQAIANGIPIVLSVDPAQKTQSSSRNVIHVYAIYGNRYVLLEAFAEKCSFSRLAGQVKKYARMHGASTIIVENTARGPDLIEEIKRDVSAQIIPVNPRGTKGFRYRKCIPIIRDKRVQLRRNRPQVEFAAIEILAYPNAEYDDHVDTMTNFLLVANKFSSDTLVSTARLQPGLAAIATSQTAHTASSTARGIAVARGTSILRPSALPDFSNGRIEPDRRPDGQSFYAAKESSEPIFSFDGQSMVRIR